MTDEERREEAEKVADFRYGLIAEFANPYLSREERRRMLAEKARDEYKVPRRGRRTLTAGCLRKWLRLYLKYGKAGLLPQIRRDAGTPRSLSPEEAALLLSHLEHWPGDVVVSDLTPLRRPRNPTRIGILPIDDRVAITTHLQTVLAGALEARR